MYKKVFHGLSRHVQYRYKSLLASGRPLLGTALMTPKPSIAHKAPRRTFLSKLFGGFSERNNRYMGQTDDALSFIRYLSKDNPKQCIRTLEGNYNNSPLSKSSPSSPINALVLMVVLNLSSVTFILLSRPSMAIF